MLRVGLDDMVLQILLLDLGEPSAFLAKAVNLQSALAVRNSLELLEGLGVVECEFDETAAASAAGDKREGVQDLKVTTSLTAMLM